jgi:hypothetical protein
MTECRVIELCFWRFLATGDDTITSRITVSSGVPIQWGCDDICDWVEGKFGDLLNGGWEFGFKFVS